VLAYEESEKTRRELADAAPARQRVLAYEESEKARRELAESVHSLCKQVRYKCVCGLEVLVYEALSYWCVRPQATSE
jgi:hypothetical protein